MRTAEWTCALAVGLNASANPNLNVNLNANSYPNPNPNPLPVHTSGLQVCSLPPAFAKMLRKEGQQKEKYKK